MPRCPECEGKGKWEHNGERVFCSICHGAGALTDEKLAGYSARKLLEAKLDLEEIVDSSSENSSRIQRIREALQASLPKPAQRYRASAWEEPPEVVGRRLSSEARAKHKKLVDDKKMNAAGLCFAAALMFGIGLMERALGFKNLLSTLTLLGGLAFLMWSLYEYLPLIALEEESQESLNSPRL